jgi:hypothetical protein
MTIETLGIDIAKNVFRPQVEVNQHIVQDIVDGMERCCRDIRLRPKFVHETATAAIADSRYRRDDRNNFLVAGTCALLSCPSGIIVLPQ